MRARISECLFLVVTMAWFTGVNANPLYWGPTTGVPDFIFGQEYSAELDKDANGDPDSQQNVFWVGSGSAWDSYDFNDPFNFPPDGITEADVQVDALANSWDVLFGNVIDNSTAALFSTRIGPPTPSPSATDAGAPARGCEDGSSICYETVSGDTGQFASESEVNSKGLGNLDGMEAGGYSQGWDADRFSLFNDAASGVSVYRADGTTYISQADLADALGIPAASIDVDALMVYDFEREIDSTFGPGDMLLFSLWPNDTAGIIGDEIWLWINGSSPTFLEHGGHLWNSGWLGINIDGFEAGGAWEDYNAPLPGTLALFSIGLFIGLWGQRTIRARDPVCA